MFSFLKRCLIPTRFEVQPNEKGYLYDKKRLVRTLDPGIYKYLDPWQTKELVTLSTVEQETTVTNQEVLTSDGIALRFSFLVGYRIVDGEKLLGKLNFNTLNLYLLSELTTLIGRRLQIRARHLIASIDSGQLNEKREEIANLKSKELNTEMADYGVEVLRAEILDLTFPKAIQDLFARQLEAKIRAKADLENARTAVASARALKNAADLMQGDESIRFFQYLETITKIAAKGKHTFMIGDMPNMGTGKHQTAD